MVTAAVRTLFLLIIIFAGFGGLMKERPADQSITDWLLVLMAAELSFIAIIRPEESLIRFLAPIFLIIMFYRLRLFSWLVFEKKSADQAPTEKQPDFEYAGSPAFAAPADERHPPMALPLVEKGSVRLDHLQEIGQTPLWLRQELRRFGYRDISQVNYLTIDGEGNFFIDLKKDTTET